MEVEIGKTLQLLRRRSHLSQIELGKRTGVHPKYISMIETGKKLPALRTLQKLTAALESNVVEFFCLMETGRPKESDEELFRMLRVIVESSEENRASLAQLIRVIYDGVIHPSAGD